MNLCVQHSALLQIYVVAAMKAIWQASATTPGLNHGAQLSSAESARLDIVSRYSGLRASITNGSAFQVVSRREGRSFTSPLSGFLLPMARLSLSELTNQLSNTRTAFEKWEEQVITQTNAAKQQHLNKLADKQRERWKKPCLTRYDSPGLILSSCRYAAVQLQELERQKERCMDQALELNQREPCLLDLRLVWQAAQRAAKILCPMSPCSSFLPTVRADLHVRITVCAELQEEQEQETSLRKKLEEVNSQSQKVEQEHQQMQQDVEQRKKDLEASEAGEPFGNLHLGKFPSRHSYMGIAEPQCQWHSDLAAQEHKGIHRLRHKVPATTIMISGLRWCGWLGDAVLSVLPKVGAVQSWTGGELPRRPPWRSYGAKWLSSGQTWACALTCRKVRSNLTLQTW